MPGTIADLPIERFERLERAILGDPEVGHLGAVERLNLYARRHDDMEERRIEGDRRLHQRLDDHIDEIGRVVKATEEEIEENERQAAAHRNKIEKKIDRLWWMLLGSTGAGFVVGWGISGAPFPTP